MQYPLRPQVDDDDRLRGLSGHRTGAYFSVGHADAARSSASHMTRSPRSFRHSSCSVSLHSRLTILIRADGLMQSFGNLGPARRTVVTQSSLTGPGRHAWTCELSHYLLALTAQLSSECYATPVRGTLYGFSAAFGKAGAAIGTQCFKVSAPILDTRN